MGRYDRRPYYVPQTEDVVLDAYFNRLVQYIGPTPAQAADPTHRSSRIQANKTGRRDEELLEMDPARMTPESRACFLGHLVRTGRREMALTKYPNLAGLDAGEG